MVGQSFFFIAAGVVSVAGGGGFSYKVLPVSPLIKKWHDWFI
jgi:hypothetical protein